MGLRETLFGPRLPEVETRAIDSFTDHPGLTEQLLKVQGLTERAWRPMGLRDALSHPAIFRAVTLLSSLGAAIPIEAFRNGSRLDPPPRIVTRPDPFRTRLAYLRSVFWNIATRGEAIEWIAARDDDGLAASLLNLPLQEVKVEWSESMFGVLRDYTWRDRKIPREDIVHLEYARDDLSPRGVGPLQLCGAAISAAVEAEDWAARFFAGGGVPSVTLRAKDGVELTADEATAARNQWMAVPSNMPQVLDGGWEEPTPLGVDPEAAQLLEARLASVGGVARMFGIDGKLLEYTAEGSSLTYQNAGDLAATLARFTLGPLYLAPFEAELSDLLPRSTACRFDVDALFRPDAKTRWEILELATAKTGIMDVAEARQSEGLDPGGTEFQSTPPAPASARPDTIPARY